MKLKEHFDTLLPINRKERFYTGTVFPMIVCNDNFKHFHLFTKLLKDCSHADIDPNPETTNIQFFTEYSLKESVFGKTKERFKGELETKDTPDILILIDGEDKTLIAIEAKMFDYPKPIDLENQMKAQEKIFEYLDKNFLEGKKYTKHHYALLPKEYLKTCKSEEIKIITWESLLDAYKDVCGNDYFFGMLKCALDEYNYLVGKGIGSFGYNSSERITGLKVYENFKNGNRDIKIIGRNKGIGGFLADIENKTWRTFKYETSTNTLPPNNNWITVEKFAELVDSRK